MFWPNRDPALSASDGAYSIGSLGGVNVVDSAGIGFTVIVPVTLDVVVGSLVRVTGRAAVAEIRLGVNELFGLARDVLV